MAPAEPPALATSGTVLARRRALVVWGGASTGAAGLVGIAAGGLLTHGAYEPPAGLLPWALRDCVDDRIDTASFLLGFLLAALGAFVWSRSWDRRIEERPVPAAVWLPGTLGALVLGAMLLLPRPAGGGSATALVAALVALTSTVACVRAVRRAGEASPPRASGSSTQDAFAWSVWDVTFLALLAAWLWTTGLATIAGQIAEDDQFHHWDCFGAGPALLAGTHWRLGADAPVMYGLGMGPALRLLCAPFGRPDYVTLLRLANVAQIAYFALLYLALRRMRLSALASVVATVVALALQFHAIDGFPSLLLRYPSASPMRWLLDMAWLHAAISFAHSRCLLPLALGGALAALMLWLETDVGAYLTVAHAALVALAAIDARPRGEAGRTLAAGFAPFALALVAFVAAYGPGALADPAFRDHVLGQAMLRAQGYAALRVDASDVPVPAAAAIPLLCVVAGILALRRRDGASRADAAWALYAAISYQYFVSRSATFCLARVATPAVVTAALLARDLDVASGLRRISARAPCVAGGLLLAVVLAASPKLLRHPNLVNGAPESVDADGAALVPARIGSMDLLLRPATAEAVTAGLAAIERLVPAGRDLAIVSDLDGLYCIASGRAPFTPRVQLAHFVTRERDLAEVLAALDDPALENVFVDARRPKFAWSREFIPLVRGRLAATRELAGRFGDLEVWRRR